MDLVVNKQQRASHSSAEEEDKYEMDEGPAFLKEGKDLSGHQSVRRPPAININPAKDDFVFMQIDTDYYTSVPPMYIKNA
jgi:hypothetical protein